MAQFVRSDFPFICMRCLGDNPYVPMTRGDCDSDTACKICTNPFPVFRWRQDRHSRYKKTEICQTCSESKGVCQVCLLDLPGSDGYNNYRARRGINYEPSWGRVRVNDTVRNLQRDPNYMRNICHLFLRGQCTSGPECPGRHEMPYIGETDIGEAEESDIGEYEEAEIGELSQQSIEDLHSGVNYPDASEAGEMPALEPRDDESIQNEATVGSTGTQDQSID